MVRQPLELRCQSPTPSLPPWRSLLLLFASALALSLGFDLCRTGLCRTGDLPILTSLSGDAARGLAEIAVLLQVATCEGSAWQEALAECAGNVAAAALEVGRSASVQVAASQECAAASRGLADSLSASRVQVGLRAAEGSSSAELLALQLTEAEAAGVEYGLVLIMGTDAGPAVRHRTTQALCGTVPQVHSVLRQFDTDSSLGLLAPLGTVADHTTKTSDIMPSLRRARFANHTTCASLFGQERLSRMGRYAPSHQSSVAAVGGNYWTRFTAFPAHAPEVIAGLRATFGSTGATARDAQLSLVEVWIPTMVREGGAKLAEIPPAPKPMAMFFPQYHPIPENDKFWGTNFTEWTLLRPFEGPQIRKPLSVEKGGLGYYDLRDVEVRRRQGELAQSYGLHGFVYYHYWFSSVDGHKVMYKVPELRIQDGHPDTPFMLSWANEAWSRHWDGKDTPDTLMLAQSYGEQEEWTAHFNYLVQFFKHPKYIRVEGKPAFVIYRPGLMKEKLEPMLELWTRMAVENGLPGLHIIATVGNFYREPAERPWETTPMLNAAFHYMASNKCCWRKHHEPPAPPDKRAVSTVEDFGEVEQAVQYWGAYAGFDNRPRKPNMTIIDKLKVSPSDFALGVQYSLDGMAHNGAAREVWDNLYFLASWNEWNEQSVLEPDDTYGFGFLEALREQLHRVPSRVYEGP